MKAPKTGLLILLLAVGMSGSAIANTVEHVAFAYRPQQPLRQSIKALSPHNRLQRQSRSLSR